MRSLNYLFDSYFIHSFINLDIIFLKKKGGIYYNFNIPIIIIIIIDFDQDN